MKYANLLHNVGAIVVILYGVLKIFRVEEANTGFLLLLGFLMAYFAQSWKIHLLERKINSLENK